MRRYIVATILLLALAGTAHAATPSAAPASERRTALVIGNSDYELISPLRNPVNDARAMARVLSDLGFEVIAKENLNRYEMRKVIRDFGRILGQGGVGLFYYAGHGVEVDGVNYLVPLEAPIKFEDDVEIEALDVNMVLGKMASAANRLNIVILDACRNNPFARSFRSTARGLAQIDAPSGTLIAYAARPGGVALDGDGENGLYTGALLDAMQVPGLRIEDVFKRVRVAVQDKSGAQQVPWESSSLTGDFYFNLNVSVTVEAPGAPATISQQETVFWQSIMDSSDPADFEVYLTEFPNGIYAGLARNRLNRLQESQTAAIIPPPEPSIQLEEMDATFVALKTSNVRAGPTTETERLGRLNRDDAVAVTGKVVGKNWYRIDFGGNEAFIFGNLIAEVDPAELTAWAAVSNSDDSADFDAFLGAFPNGNFKDRAATRRDALAQPVEPVSKALDHELAFWDTIKGSRNPGDYRAYLFQYPDGAFAELARVRIAEAERKEEERKAAVRRAAEEAARVEAEYQRLAAEEATRKEAKLATERKAAEKARRKSFSSITVVSWGGGYTASQKKAYGDTWGGRIRWESYNGGLGEVRKQVKSRNVQWDIVDVLPHEARVGCDEGLFEKLPRYKFEAAPDGTPMDRDIMVPVPNDCVVPQIFWSYLTFYDRAKFPGRKPKTIADFFDVRKFPGKRAIHSWPNGLIEMALIADGVDPRNVYGVMSTSSGINRAFAKLDTIKNYVVFWASGAKPLELVANGTVAMATGYNGRISVAILSEGASFVPIWDGQVLEEEWLVMIKGSKNYEAALDFLIHASAPEQQAAQAKWIPYGPMRKSALEIIANNEPWYNTGVNIMPFIPNRHEVMARSVNANPGWWARNGDRIAKRFVAWMQ